MTSEPPPLRAGQALGRYELLLPIAKGGMGQVWAGRLRGARGFQKLVAIKTVLPAREDTERMERMLFEEARIAGLIQHANVAQTLELGEDRGILYLVMEWVDGEPLSAVMKSCEGAEIPLLVAVNLIGQALRGLQAAHELCDEQGVCLGVVHRDVSPHNLLVSYTGGAKLVDFGIAKAMNQSSSSTETGEIKGKFAYMAPEQILVQDVDQRADLFAVGIILYLLTTGQHPFKNHDPASVLHSITSQDEVPRASLVKPGYSRTLESIVMKALEKDRQKRWASAAEMRLALQSAVPDAFAPGIENVLEAFMTRTVGGRAAEKREALRQAELRSARRRSSSGSLPSVGGTAQSASSLRAFSVDSASFESDAPLLRLSLRPTERPASEPELVVRKPRRFWPAAAALTATLILVLVGFRETGSAHRARAGSSALVPLSSREERHLLRGSVPTVPAEQAASPLVAASSAPGAEHGATEAVGGATGTATVSPSESSGPRLRSKPKATRTTDLIAPEYAR